ncbi:hypothetical protein RDABS01_026504 [Bienertia sinuspersici]
MNSSALVKHISECFIKPQYEVEEANKPVYLAPMDLVMLSVHYIQKGLLFTKPPSNSDDQISFSTPEFLESLKESLSHTLVYFYPLAGQLATQVDEARQESLVFVDCNKGPGARLVHATIDMTVSDILTPRHVPAVVQSFFDHDRAVNHDGHHMSLLTIQVTELLDGVFIGCSMNHALGDGTSYWNFWNVWSEIHMAKNRTDLVIPSSHLPIHNRWFPDGHDAPILLPFTRHDQFVSRYEAPPLAERIFHFSPESMSRLKSKANKDHQKIYTDSKRMISSFQALSALCWRSIIRAIRLPDDQVTNCRLAANNRHRLDPPLPENYFGNCINAITTTTTVSELHEHSLGWAASMLHQSVANHTNKALQDFLKRWLKSPFVYQIHQLFDSNSVMMGSSPRFDMYGNEFGLGKPVAVRSGYAHKFTGKVTSYQGYEGGGSVDLEICLPPHAMEALESDEEFMGAVSLPLTGY